MKKLITMLMAVIITTSMIGCAKKQAVQDEDICPGKLLGDECSPMAMADGFDQTIDMTFHTKDTNGMSVTNEIFSGTEHGVWLIFWQTDNDKSLTALTQLNDMLPIAEENGYKVVGIVMDGEENFDKAKEMTTDLGFSNIIWNDEVASRYSGVSNFFSKEYYENNKELYSQITVMPNLGDPVSTMANSRGQLQSSCTLIPMSNEEIENKWRSIDSNATFEELMEQAYSK